MMTFSRRQRRKAFDKIVTHYESALLRYASRLLNNPANAQDVVQNSFIKLFKRWHDKMEPSPAISSWLYRVVHNEAVDLIRSESRRRELYIRQAQETPRFAKQNTGSRPDISDEAIRADKALRQLPERNRQIVILKVYEEMSYREISDITGLSIGNIGYILHHALKTLATEIQRMEDHEER